MVIDNDPLAQFQIKTIWEGTFAGIDITFTNASLWMVMVVSVISFFLIAGIRKQAVVPGRGQLMVEMLYEFVANLVRDNAGKEGRPYFPFVFTLFIMILGMNLAGMLPYSYTVTSHIIITITMALFVFIGVTIIGFWKNGLGFLRLFAPAGAPFLLYFILVPIEIISYCVRPISLSVRLFANMLAGHIMMKIFAGFVISLTVALGVAGGFMAVLPFAFNIFLTGLEILVALLQAYVFAALTCLYLHDAFHPAH